MIYPDGKVSEPPPQKEKIDNDEKDEKNVQKTTNTLTNLDLNSELSQDNTPTQQQKSRKQKLKYNTSYTKNSSSTDDDTNGVDVTQRTIEVANTVVINNERITTPVIFQFCPPSNTLEFSVSKVCRNIFEALKLLDPTLKFVTFQGTHINTIEQFLSTQDTYTSTFKDIHKENDTSRVYVCHKIESAKPLGELKHGSRYCMSNIFDTLVIKNAFLLHKQFNSHKEN